MEVISHFFSKIITNALDESKLSKNIDNLVCILEKHLSKEPEEEKPVEVLEYYFLASEVSKNKSIIALTKSNGESRPDYLNNTVYKLYDAVTNTPVGEVAAFYSKIKSESENKFYYQIVSTTTFINGRTISGQSSTILDSDSKIFIFPEIDIVVVDYNNKNVKIKTVKKPGENPDKVFYKCAFF
jgi:hypothetical protein